MAALRTSPAVTMAAFFSLLAPAQQAAPVPPQTARQALIEMFTGGEQGLTKHLTIEAQQALNQKGQTQAASTIKLYSGALAGARNGVQTFDGGPVLVSFAEPNGHEKTEIHVDNDDLSGDQDNLGLSIHSFADGQEQAAEWQSMVSHFTVEMKRQEGVWRLNKVTIGVELSLGDPAFLEQIFGKGAENMPAGTHLAKPIAHAGDPVGPSESTLPAMAPQDVVTILALAESFFARQHPDAGFTCSLVDLAESAKLLGVDPQISTGTYNGYRFAVKGCEGKPAGSYQLTAEPAALSPGAQAFCTDATQNVRVGEDGRAATCLVAGKTRENHTAEEGGMGMVGFRLGAAEAKPKQ